MISVCMPYYERQELLDRSLEAYRALYGTIVDINICDDGSETPVHAPGCRVHYLPAKKGALNPCVPINMAVRMAMSDVIVLTNPEILHTTPILQSMFDQLLELGNMGYITASCKAEDGRWLAHSSIKEGEAGRGYMPDGWQFHFCAMFHRHLWERTGGFDEDYRPGQAFDDNDWLWRLHRAGADYHHRDDLVVEHTHTGTRWPPGGWQRNHILFTRKWGDYIHRQRAG